MFEGAELSYEMTTVFATANAINSFVEREHITDYKATVIIDGLPRSTQVEPASCCATLVLRPGVLEASETKQTQA